MNTNNRNIYRRLSRSADLIYTQLKVEQTDLLIAAHRQFGAEARKAVEEERKALTDWIGKYPGFLTALTPYPITADAPEIIQLMTVAALKAGTGQMAAVAGAVCERLATRLPYDGELLIENGGDIYMRSDKERTVQLFTGSREYGSLGIRLSKELFPCGICTSSGKIGHSLSFGKADTATVICKSTAEADACATQLGNMLKTAADISGALSAIREVPGVLGAVAAIDGSIGAFGKLELVRL